ncbi:Zn(2)-C6 fungal-type domain-containing protein [Mycena indigotica]|uniref:Zn(2)-C6 fungal-type domain-containing protein n=1 Tax=Mycena indigotica TaxID=2126181 RepID=A0A8H6VQP9_9AGAR|nr:Zn(2)-C6 fungal-type domain-containing protein [Mycena indigotica]KAF7290522.1 Zn(2)-C6 fungal-type domain-containing protein [Mycena indigotica]
MSSSSIEKRKKPPACDACKARRVLCHPQPNGAPCPRCVEKNVICTTTAIPRGRPRKTHAASQSSPGILVPESSPAFRGSVDRPELTPDFVSHCFDALKYLPQINHPLIAATSIKNDIRAVCYQLHLLPLHSRVLALCLMCVSSLASFHPLVLGDGPRPTSFNDHEFFASAPCDVLLSCGIRRQLIYRALRDEALKLAWEAGTLLQPSAENAASCYLLDVIEQIDFVGPSRPWASAYLAHIRALAPHWHVVGFNGEDATQWAGYLECNLWSYFNLVAANKNLQMTETIVSATNRTPLLLTPHDQMLLTGPVPPPLDAFLTSLEKTSKSTNSSVLWTSVRPFLYHVTNLSRQLSETIAGDYPRLEPLAEGAVLKFLTALTMLQSALALLTERIDAVLDNDVQVVLSSEGMTPDMNLRTTAYVIAFGFAAIALAFYRELEYRDTLDTQAQILDGRGTRERIRLLRAQTRELCLEGAKEFAKGFKRLPRIHYSPTPLQGRVIASWAEFCATEAGEMRMSPETQSVLQVFSEELKLSAYSFSGQQVAGLISRVDVKLGHLLLTGGSNSAHPSTSTFSSSLFTGDAATAVPQVGAFVDLNLELGTRAFSTMESQWLNETTCQGVSFETLRDGLLHTMTRMLVFGKGLADITIGLILFVKPSMLYESVATKTLATVTGLHLSDASIAPGFNHSIACLVTSVGLGTVAASRAGPAATPPIFAMTCAWSFLSLCTCLVTPGVLGPE